MLYNPLHRNTVFNDSKDAFRHFGFKFKNDGVDFNGLTVAMNKQVLDYIDSRISGPKTSQENLTKKINLFLSKFACPFDVDSESPEAENFVVAYHRLFSGPNEFNSFDDSLYFRLEMFVFAMHKAVEYFKKK